MKRILLTSTALVAFAGAAAADVSFSGDAEFSYNSIAGFDYSTSITASGSAALDNGYTASASLTIDEAGAVSTGNVSISSDMASITYHVDDEGEGAAYIGDNLSQMTTGTRVFGDGNNEDSTVTGSVNVGGATVKASIAAGGAYQLGVSTDLGGTALAVGFDDGDFGAQLSGAASTVDYTLAFASDNAYAINASTTAGGADLSLNFGSDGWDIGAEMALGGATVGVTLDDAQAWEVSVSTTLDAVALGLSFDSANAWEMTAGYSAGAVGFDFATDSTNAWSIDATYDLGNGITVGAGTDSAAAQYVEVDYDLGGGAAAAVTYATAADINPGEDILEGTTVAVSFSF